MCPNRWGGGRGMQRSGSAEDLGAYSYTGGVSGGYLWGLPPNKTSPEFDELPNNLSRCNLY